MTGPFQPNDRFTVSQDQVSSEIGEETALLHLGNAKYFGLNDVGTFVWRLLQKPISFDGMLHEMLDAFEVDADVCSEDLTRLLEALLAKGLVTIDRNPS